MPLNGGLNDKSTCTKSAAFMEGIKGFHLLEVATL
jgi:hypothetical protein